MSLAHIISLQPSSTDDDLPGAEYLAADLRALSRELDNLKAAVLLKRKEFLTFLSEHCTGQAGTKASIASADGRPVSVSWTGQYKPIDARHEPLMREVLGDTFDDLFEVRVSVKARKGLTMEELEATLGDDLSLLLRVCEVTPSVAPQPGYTGLRHRAGLRLDNETLEVIDDVVAAVQYEPRVRLK